MEGQQAPNLGRAYGSLMANKADIHRQGRLMLPALSPAGAGVVRKDPTENSFWQAGVSASDFFRIKVEVIHKPGSTVCQVQ